MKNPAIRNRFEPIYLTLGIISLLITIASMSLYWGIESDVGMDYRSTHELSYIVHNISLSFAITSTIFFALREKRLYRLFLAILVIAVLVTILIIAMSMQCNNSSVTFQIMDTLGMVGEYQSMSWEPEQTCRM